MSPTRSILLLFLSFAVGFIGPLFVHMAQNLWGELFANGSLATLVCLAVLWGTPRGIAERKLIEVGLGAIFAFAGLVLVSGHVFDFVAPIVQKAEASRVIQELAESVRANETPGLFEMIVRNAILGLFLGAIDGAYERRAGKALLGAVLAAVLSVPAAFVERYVGEDAQETFVHAMSLGVAICLIHAATIVSQFLSGSKYGREEQHQK